MGGSLSSHHHASTVPRKAGPDKCLENWPCGMEAFPHKRTHTHTQTCFACLGPYHHLVWPPANCLTRRSVRLVAPHDALAPLSPVIQLCLTLKNLTLNEPQSWETGQVSLICLRSAGLHSLTSKLINHGGQILLLTTTFLI